MSGMPMCECAGFWEEHHPECPVRREIERLRQSLTETTRQRDQFVERVNAFHSGAPLSVIAAQGLKDENARLRSAIEAMRIAGGSAEFQMAFAQAKALAREEGK